MNRVVIHGMRRMGRSHALELLLAERMRRGLTPYAITIDNADFWGAQITTDRPFCSFVVTCCDPSQLSRGFSCAEAYLDLNEVAEERLAEQRHRLNALDDVEAHALAAKQTK